MLPGLTVAESSACEDRAVCGPAALGPQWSSVACSQSQTAEPHLWGAGQALGSSGRWGCPGQSPWGEAASLPWHLAPGSQQRHLTRRWLGSPGRWTGRCPDSLSAISLSTPPLPPSDVLVSDPAPPAWPLRTPAVSNVPGQLSRAASNSVAAVPALLGGRVPGGRVALSQLEAKAAALGVLGSGGRSRPPHWASGEIACAQGGAGLSLVLCLLWGAGTRGRGPLLCSLRVESKRDHGQGLSRGERAAHCPCVSCVAVDTGHEVWTREGLARVPCCETRGHRPQCAPRNATRPPRSLQNAARAPG